MFGWRRRKARKNARRTAGGAHLQETVDAAEVEAPNPSSETVPPTPSADTDVDIDDDEPGPGDEAESEPDVVRTERPMVDLLTDGERLGFDPEPRD